MQLTRRMGVPIRLRNARFAIIEDLTIQQEKATAAALGKYLLPNFV